MVGAVNSPSSLATDVDAALAQLLTEPGGRRELAEQIAGQLDDLRVLTSKDVAELLVISVDSVYDLTKRLSDPLPMARLGLRGQLRIRRSTLRDWIARQEGAR